MTGGEVYVTRLSAWAPGIGSSRDWDEWANGKRDIFCNGTRPDNSRVVRQGPEISFTDSMFRRRLSQISKMTIQVIHDLMPLAENTKIFFLSFRGELSRQFQINKMLFEEKTLSPAAFSLSVFNAPVALASMALGLKGGYTTLYPGKKSFASGVMAAQAALMCGASEELCLVYADEEVQSEYTCLCRDTLPVSFGLLLSRIPSPSHIPFPVIDKNDSPLDFLKRFLLRGEIHVSP